MGQLSFVRSKSAFYFVRAQFKVSLLLHFTSFEALALSIPGEELSYKTLVLASSEPSQQ